MCMTPEQIKLATAMVAEAQGATHVHSENEWREEFAKIAVYTNEYGYVHKIPKYTEIESLIEKTLDQHSARIVERLEAEKKKHTNDPEAKHYNDEIYCCLDCYDEGRHDKGIDRAIDIINNKNE